MSARVLVVDDIPANVLLLAAKLHSEYYDVITAANGEEALAAVEAQAPDVILLDVMMPGMDGFEVCRRIKGNPRSAHIPVVMVTALSDIDDRVQGLDAGADDFLTKPVNDVVLFARVRSLVRMKRAGDEWRTREATLMRFAGPGGAALPAEAPGGARILLAIDECDLSDLIEGTLRGKGHDVVVVRDPGEAAAVAGTEEFQLVLSDCELADQDALRFCSLLRSGDRTRHWPILLIVQDDDADRLAKALELGVSDYLVRPVIEGELIARVSAQLRRKWYEDGLRKTYERSVAAAITDGLTGLNNRRFLEAHYAAVERELAGSRPISLMILDVDRFKEINDSFGHAVGDEVLKSLAQRLQSLIRGSDTAARFGGEEFVVLMPNTPKASAAAAAGRLCKFLGSAPYPVSGGPGELPVTVSIGVATVEAGEGTLDGLIRQADAALYRAKRAGRNRYEVAGEVETEVPGAGGHRAAS